MRRWAKTVLGRKAKKEASISKLITRAPKFTVQYLLLVLWIIIVSATFILLGNVNEITSMLCRSPNNPAGIITCYFVHENWEHLLFNAFSYILYAVFIQILVRIPGNPLNILSRRRNWYLLNLSLMIVLSIADLTFNPLYRRGVHSCGMSDLTYAMSIGTLASVYGVIPAVQTKDRKEKSSLAIGMLLLIIGLSGFTVISIVDQYDALVKAGERVNIPAHLLGIAVAFFTFTILLYLNSKKHTTRILTPFMVNVLAILLSIHFLLGIK